MYAVFARHVFASFFSFGLAYYLVPIMIKTAHKLKFLDVPDGKIKFHAQTTPYLGGVAIFVPFIATLGLVFPIANHILWFLLGTTLLFFIGLIDDLAVLKPYQKFAAQIIAMLCFLKGGFSLRTQFLSHFVSLGFSAFWILSVINAFNLIDVMDGLSSSVAITATGVFFCFALFTGQYTLSLLLLCFAAPVMAFLWYNKPPARIYLGDAGSLFIGGYLAAMPLFFSWSAYNVLGYLVPLFIFAVPLLEITALVVIRTYLGIPFYHGSPHHFSMFLKARGWSVGAIDFFAATTTLLFSAVGFAFLFQQISLLTLFVLGFVLTSLWVYVCYVRSALHNGLTIQPARLNREVSIEPSTRLPNENQKQKHR